MTATHATPQAAFAVSPSCIGSAMSTQLSDEELLDQACDDTMAILEQLDFEAADFPKQYAEALRQIADAARPVREAGPTEILVAAWLKDVEPEELEGLRARVFWRVVDAMRGRQLHGRGDVAVN